MKYYPILLTVSILLFCFACTNTAKKPSGETSGEAAENTKPISSVKAEFPILLEYEKKYPQKEIYLQDIADVTYSKFSDKNVLLERGVGNYMAVSDQFKIIRNPKEGMVFVLDKNNKLINKFNHTGGGPEEYQSIHQMCVDFNNNEIFIFDFPSKYKALVYSFDGKFKRDFTLKQPLWIESILDYDKENLLVCFKLYESGKNADKNTTQFSHYLLSKENGSLTPIPVHKKYSISNTIMTTNAKGRPSKFGIPSSTIVGNGTDFIISDFGSDTIYLKNDKGLQPFIIKSPSVEDSEEPVLVYTLSRNNNYTFLRKIIRRKENNGMTDFAIDNKTGEIFEIKIINRDFPSKNYSVEAFNINQPQNTAFAILSTSAFIERNQENLLSGKLKEFVSTLTDDDNDFLISIKYK